MSELEAMRLREEVLQAMYWMRSEGLGERPRTDELARFLAMPEPALAPYLDRFAAEGHIEAAGGGWSLTDAGTQLGRRSFADEFADVTRGGHGECDADCWCHDSPDEALRCLEDRAGHRH